MEVVDSDLVVEDTGAAAKHYLRTHLFDAIIVPLAISLTVIMVGIAMSFLGFEMPPALLGIALLFAPILILINYSLAKSRAQREFMSRFATANGYSFSPTGTLEGLDGVLFQIGRERHVTDVVSGNYQGSSVSLFLYDFTTDEKPQFHAYTVFKMNSSAHMPDIFLGHRNRIYGEEDLSLFLPQAMEPVVLEGDFGKYFTLRIQKGSEIEALEVFTPDVMEEFKEKCKLMSAEVVNGNLYLYLSWVVGSKNQLLELYTAAEYLTQKLAPVLSRMGR